MAILNFNPKRILAGILTVGIFFMYAVPLPVLASEISGINPVSQGGKNTYNIDAAKVHGSTGFRHYDKFNLTQGDIANLKFNNYTKFVNLVNNKITINGIVNTMKGNNFYNGHAIFVSPNGFVLGASGVLNVGALSVLTPSQSKFNDFKSKYDANNLADYIVGADKYKELLKDSHGTVDINGKILSRGDVELYGDTINIKGTSSDKAGIVAGIGNNNNVAFTDEDAAKALFNTLVANNITDTTNFALENGKVKIVAGFKEYTGEGDNKKPDGASNKAEVTIEDAQIGGDEIEIKANSTKDGTYIVANAAEAISSKIDIKNSNIVGNDIDVLANSESILSRNINITVPTVLLWIFDGDAHLDEYFSEGVYTGFEGVRTKATVTVKDSVLNALDENLSIEARSSSETKIGSQVIGPVELSQFVPAIFYGYGTQTESKINVENSTLKAKKKVDLNAFSSNVLSAKVADECVLGINLKMTDAYNLAFMKNSAIADTKITIDNSTVEGENVSMQSLAYNEMDNRVILKTRIGKNDFQDEIQGGSSASLAGILNATDIKSSIEVKNNSKITATEDVKMNAYNINDVSNWVDSEVSDPLGYTKEWKESDKWLLKQFDRLGRTYTSYDQITHFTIKDFKDKFTKKGQNIYSQVWPEDKQTLANANFQAGAGVVWNSAETTNNVIISNSKITAKNINIKAHTVDATVNETDAYAEEDANWGGAFALVVNKQTNNNKVDILDTSKLTAEEKLSVDSIVELPAQQGTFGLSTNGMFGVKFTLALNFGMKPNDEWDFGFHNVGKDAPSEKLIPEIGLFGFYNNFAAASAAGDKASISGAVIYNQINNNSDINITNSELKSTKNITMNSVVSASAHDAVDFFNYDGILDIIKGIKTFNKWNSDSGNGGGGAVLVQNFTQNARITVDNSTLESEEGNINLNTAAEQSYLNLVTPGGKAETIGINGAVSVQKVHGTTGTTVKNGSELTANNISIDSGKVNVQFTKKGSDMGATGLEFLNDDDEVELAALRDAKDHITAVALDGTFTKQSEESTAPTSQGAAFGASVIVQNIDRTIKSLVDNSTLTAGNIDIKSESYTRNIFVTLAGSFAGGVSPSTETQNQANAGGGGAQEMQNVGNWMDILDNAQPDDEDILGLNNLFNENNPNQQGAQNAHDHANDINNQDAQVGNDGNVNPGGAHGNNPGNNNGNMANNAANPGNATSNFSLALAGSVSVVYDESKVESVVQNSTVNVEKELNVTSDRDHFMLNVSGGITKSGTVGGGAAVNVYTDKGGAKSLVDNSKIIFTSDEAAKKVNVTADDKHYIVNVGVGVGISGGGSTGGDSQKFDAAIGGSFNTNRLLGTSEAKITNNSEIKNDFKKDEDGNPTTEVYSNDIDVKVKAKGDTTIWNTGGDAGIATGGSSAKFQLGAAVAGNMNFLEQKINSEISNSTLTNVKNVDIISDLDQKINAISVAAAVTQRSDYSFNLEGALGLEFIKNSVTALLKDSTVSSSGDVKLLADSDIEGQTLTGDITIEAGKGIGVGIGVVLGIDNSTVSSKIDGGTISKAASIESKANSVDNRKFLAVNLGLSDSSYTILTNSVVNIYKTTVESKVINNAELTSTGAVNLLSNYENSNQGITAIAEKTQDSLAFGANILASSYANTVKSELENGSKILNSGSVRIDAGTSEKINYIPAALAIATGHGSSVAADVVVNVIKNNTYANVYGNVKTIGKLVVKALDDTTIYERGGVLAYSGEGTVGIGSIVYFDYLNKTVQAEIKNNTVYAGDMTVQATAVNSFGGTKKEDGTWDVSDMSTSASDYGANFHENSSFKNWTMAYSLSHGDSAGASGAVVVRVLDDIIKANVEGVTLGSDEKKASSLTIYANDYTIMNTIAGQFTPSDLAAGGNAIFAFSNTDVKATLTGGTQILTGDLSIGANSEKVSHTVLVGGSGADKVAVNGAVFVNKTTDKVTSSLIGSTVTANKVIVDSRQKNDSLGVDVSVAGSGKFSLGGILYLNLYNDTTKALVGDNDKARTTITSSGDIEVNSDSDYEAREYLLSVGASGKIGVSGLGIANVMDATIESGVYNSDVTSSNGKLDVNAYRWFNKGSASKTAFFRNWFKGTNAYAKQNSQITANDLKGMAPIVGALNVSAGGVGAGSGTIVVNKARGTLTSKIDNSTVSTKKGAKVSAQQNFTNFDAVAAVAGSAHASLNGVGVINSLAETVTAEVSNSTVSKGSITTDAQSNMNLNQLVVSGQGAGQGAAIGVVVDSNNIEDKVYSYIISTTAEAGAGANSAHNIMINNIMLAGGGVGQGLSANVAVVLNKFLGAETFSKIDGSTINGGDINLSSFDNLDNLSAIVGVSAAGQGANLSGYAIRNELSNKSKAFISNTTINTTGRVNIYADSVINTTNALFSAGIVAQGASILANVISNTITSEVESYIKDSTIKKSGKIKITANVNNDTNKYRYDDITNTTGNVSFAAQGAALATNVIYNNYSNKVKSYIENTSSDSISYISLDAGSERRLYNTNIGIGGAAMGAAVAVNAISTKIDTETSSYIDAKSKTMDNVGSIYIYAKDDSVLKNIMGTIQVAGIGAAAGVNLDMTWSNNLVKAEILSDAAGQINTNSVKIDSDNIIEFSKTNVGVSLGAVGLAGDYVLIKTGKRTGTYTDSEKDCKIDSVINLVDSQYVPTPTGDIESGAVAQINGNVKTVNNIDVNAESKIKGLDQDKLSLTNVTVTVGIGTGSVGVKDVDLASNTNASISGGTVESKSGKVSVNAKNTSKTDITNVQVKVEGLGFSGGSAMYTNSSETVAQIKDATVKSGNGVDVIADSTSNSEIHATNVVVTGGQIVSVDLAENKDTNTSAALITGNTNIDTKGKLTVHSTVNTDLQSTKTTVTVSGVSFATAMKNEVVANTIAQAVIKDVTGTIKTSGLDIITDYSRMYALSKSNITSVKLGSIYSEDKSGVRVNAGFLSGIDSLTGLTINNSGTTNIITARDNGTEGILAKGEIHNVTVSLIGFYAGTSANATNNSYSNTLLKVKDHTAENLTIDSYLNSQALADSGATKVDLFVGVNSSSVESKDTSVMNVEVGGKNKINQDVTINAAHRAKIYTDMSAFGFSLVGAGTRVRLTSDLVGNTTGTINGDFNANSTSINFNTTRESVLSKSSGSGSLVVSVSDSRATNHLTGASTLTVSNMNTDASVKNNNLTVKNTSTNTMDIKSSEGSGAGLIAVSQDHTDTIFNTSTTTNIVNSNINSNNNVGFEVSNNAVVKDSAKAGAGSILVAVADHISNNSYTSNAKLSLQNSTINAQNVNLKTSSDIRTPENVMVDYKGGAGGFIAENEMRLTNTMNQTSEIEIKNSKIYASKDIVLKALTSSLFRQRTDSTVGGFTAMPRSKNWLNVTNNDLISIDANSQLRASDKFDIDFDSNNTLEARAISEAHHFGFRDPVAESYINLTVNNTLTNSGSIEAGNLVDIDFMNNSTNNLTQHAYSEAHAAIPTTTENGQINKTVNNTLKVRSGADITSGKDVEISYSTGGGSTSSYINWKAVCYALFGIPIPKNGTPKSKISNVHTPKLEMEVNGKIVAGQGNSKYMKINRDGTVDKETLKGFYDDDYTLSDGVVISGAVIKQKTLDSIRIEIINVEKAITETEVEITAVGNKIADLNIEKSNFEDQLGEINGLIGDGYTLKSNDDFNTMVINDIKNIVINDSTAPVSESVLNTIATAYNDLTNYIAEYNGQHPSETISVPTISEFFNKIDTYDNSIITDAQKTTIKGLSNEQRTTVQNGYNTVLSRMSITEKGKFTVYTKGSDKYISATNPTGTGASQTCDEITNLNSEIAVIEGYIAPYEEKKSVLEGIKTASEAQKNSLQDTYNQVENTPDSEYEQRSGEYSIVFNDIYSHAAHITISGASSIHISPQGTNEDGGTFSVASSGLKIDNYSTRTIVFNDIALDNTVQSGLIIDGKNFNEFVDKPQAVSGWDAYHYVNNNWFWPSTPKSFDDLEKKGVHYVNGSGGITGITVNNYYDVLNPFASSQTDVPFNTLASDIFFTGDIKNSADFTVWNESGNIGIVTDEYKAGGKTTLIASQGAIGIVDYNENDNYSCNKITLKSGDRLFAGDMVELYSKDFDIAEGVEINSGYSNRNITITNEMLNENNLIVDPVTGEKNLVNLGGEFTPYTNATNNIKVIYKNNKLYLFDIKNTESGVDIGEKLNSNASEVATGTATGTISANANIHAVNGYRTITIDNQTAKELVVHDITNAKNTGTINVNNSTRQVTEIQNPTTTITSTGKLTLDGIIRNCVQFGIPDYVLTTDNGTLQITAENGLDINPQRRWDSSTTTMKDYDSIYAKGGVDITVNEGNANINGTILDKGILRITKNGSGDMNLASNITDENGSILITTNDSSNTNITGDIECSGDINGGIDITQHGTGKLEISSNIDVDILKYKNEDEIDETVKGNLRITTFDTSDLTIYGTTVLTNMNGSITIQNSGSGNFVSINGIIFANGGLSSVTINVGDALQSTVNAEIYSVGNVLIENLDSSALTISNVIAAINGDIKIRNEFAGNLTIESSAEIINYSEPEYDANGNMIKTYGITITNENNPDVNSLDISGNVYNYGGGAIEITNNGNMGAYIGGNVYNDIGAINITNNTDMLEITGEITANKGSINITNNGAYTTAENEKLGIRITNKINGTDGNITITNTKGSFEINPSTNESSAAISLNTTDGSSANTGSIYINNGENAGQLELSDNITNGGIGSIVIDNKSTTGATVINGNISNNVAAEDGIGISISNAAGDLTISGNVTNNKGSIGISNSGTKVEIAKLIENKEGNTTIEATKGNLIVGANAKIINNKDNADKSSAISLTVGENGGNIITSGEITNYGTGDIEIINNGASGTDDTGIQIGGTISNANGNITISNANKGLAVSDYISNTKGNINISNSGGNGALIDGIVEASEGNITITNTNDAIAVIGYIFDEKGNISISNSGEYGSIISGIVCTYDGNVSFENTKGGADIYGIFLTNNGNISILNHEGELLIDTDSAIYNLSENPNTRTVVGNITIENDSTDDTIIFGDIYTSYGVINITNSNKGELYIDGLVENDYGNIDISNTSDDKGTNIATTGYISATDGNIEITNKNGMNIFGFIKTYGTNTESNIQILNTNGDITIGEYTSANDKYIDVTNGNVSITQTNGNILNGIVDPSNSTHSNYDLGNPNHAYKTLISTTNDLTLDVENGDIGVTSNSNPGYGIDATTRDYTDSINVNIGGSVVAKALNSDANSTDVRLINLRAKESDLTIKNVVSDGNIILTSADWKQADTRPVPDPESEKPEDAAYYTGYSILAVPSNSGVNLAGQNISVISSNNIGTENNKLVYQQDSVKAPNSSVSFEAENDINLTGKATPGGNIRINHLVTKRGSIDFDMESDAEIIGITAGKGLKLTQKAQNLTIRNLGLPDTTGSNFQDMLNPHDDLVYGDGGDPSKAVVPNYVNIKVLDAIDTPERSESNLNIYTAYVKGNHGKNTHYYPDGSRLADVTLMADNIYAASFIAPDSKVSTKTNPKGVKVGGGTYTNTDIDPTDTNVYVKKGINSYGSGEAISVDILGVDEDVVKDIVPVAQRNKYGTQTSKTNIPEIFKNKEDRTKFFDYDFKADNVYLSVNDYATENRGVSIDTVYAKNAYINTHDTNLSVEDGFINNYAEFRNASKLAVVDNDFRRTVNSDIQLFTKKTGSFGMGLSNSTIMKTTAPVVDFNPYHLVNGYSSENSFVNLTFKETAVRQHNKNTYKELQRKTDYYNKSVSLVFSAAGFDLLSENGIYEVSRTGAIIDAKDLKIGQGVNINLKCNDIDIDVEATVKEIHGDKAKVQFLNMPEEISNELMYEYMKKVNAMKNSISSL